MRKTRKHNKNFRKTQRKGGGKGTLKLLPPLPPSPPSSPKTIVPNTNQNVKNKLQIKVEPKNLLPVERYTHNWYKRQGPRIVLQKVKQPSLWNRLIGRKREEPKAVPLDSEGYPIKSAFNINKNSGFKP